MSRSERWKWWVSGLLLAATMINYMDRQTLASVSVRVTMALGLSEEQFGDLEMAFGLAFAAGSLFFGILTDYLPIRWLYPTVLLGWSAAGILTGYSRDYWDLLTCRTVLGFFEAGHWPCAIVTIQRIMSVGKRHMANSLLQSGAAFGAILTPLIILAILWRYDPHELFRQSHQALGGGIAVAATGPAPDVWSIPFIVIGAAGCLWIVAWFLLIGPRDLLRTAEVESTATPPQGHALFAALADRRFWVLLLMVIALNTTWQILRAWLPKYLQQGRGYLESSALLFNSAYYLAADVGCILSGAVAIRLANRGYNTHRTRIAIFAVCTAITSLTITLAAIPTGPLLLGTILVIGGGALGLFPCYYSFTQELSREHIGKLSGLLAALGWAISSPLQKLYGMQIDATKSFERGIGLAGLAPWLGLIMLLLFWRTNPPESPKKVE